MRTFLKAVGSLFLAIVVIVGGGLAWLALRSPEMRPASAERVASDARLVARGEYLFHHA